jgi:hypothetical protein
MITVMPLRYNEKGECLNPRLEQLAVEFCKREFGLIDFTPYKQSMFCAVKGGLGEIPEVVGIMGITFTLDLSLFHAASQNGRKLDEAVISSRMIRRLHEYLIDRGFEGRELLIHINPDAESKWTAFNSQHDAQRADRWSMRIKPDIEVTP